MASVWSTLFRPMCVAREVTGSKPAGFTVVIDFLESPFGLLSPSGGTTVGAE